MMNSKESLFLGINLKNISRIVILIFFIASQIVFTHSAQAAECIKTVVTTGGYNYYAFTSIGACQFTLPAGATQMDYLVVAGGGGGASRAGGGGGGAGAPGGASSTTTTGAGGNGLTISWITTSIANSLSVGDTVTGSAYFAGGGSGGRGAASGTPNIGIAGYGGGGLGIAGCSSDTCTAGGIGKTSTTGGGGGGGGGGYQFSPDRTAGGGKGGSGVVVIRILQPATSLSIVAPASVIYRSTSVISVTANVPGKVTFLANRKRIAGCISIRANLTATCNWKPSGRGSISISATFTPTDSAFLPSDIGVSAIQSSKRVITR